LPEWCHLCPTKLSRFHNKSKTCEGQYHHDTSAVSPPYTPEVIALVASCLPTGFLYLSHHILAEAVVELHGSVALLSVAEGEDEGLLACVLLKQRVLPLFLLVKGVDYLLQLGQSCYFSLDLLSSCFGALGCGSPSCDDFLLLVKPLNCLLHLG
jgi:hypothetical protein